MAESWYCPTSGEPVRIVTDELRIVNLANVVVGDARRVRRIRGRPGRARGHRRGEPPGVSEELVTPEDGWALQLDIWTSFDHAAVLPPLAAEGITIVTDDSNRLHHLLKVERRRPHDHPGTICINQPQ